jgi:hypothetical protein
LIGPKLVEFLNSSRYSELFWSWAQVIFSAIQKYLNKDVTLDRWS